MSLATGDLTTLAAAKAYMANPPSDPVLSGLITRISRQIQSILNRSAIVPTTYTQQFSGTCTGQLVLPDWPVTTLTSLVIGGVAISIAPQLSSVSSPSVPYGYRFQPWNGRPPGQPAVLNLVGTNFWWGSQNVVATYTAGYQVTSESQVVPATPFQLTPKIPYGSWATDQGVVNVTTGLAMTAMLSGTPTTGQYLAPDPNAAIPRLYYTFAPVDTGQTVLLSYGFIPADLEQAALDLVAERASYRARVGLRSQSLAGQETISFDLHGLPDYIVEMLRPYESVIPPAMGAPL